MDNLIIVDDHKMILDGLDIRLFKRNLVERFNGF